MTDYLSQISLILGIPLWILLLAFIWSAVWKLLALWKSARKGSVAWFVILAVVNTLGILPILYIFIFSEMDKRTKVKKKVKTRVKRKK